MADLDDSKRVIHEEGEADAVIEAVTGDRADMASSAVTTPLTNLEVAAFPRQKSPRTSIQALLGGMALVGIVGTTVVRELAADHKTPPRRTRYVPKDTPRRHQGGTGGEGGGKTEEDPRYKECVYESPDGNGIEGWEGNCTFTPLIAPNLFLDVGGNQEEKATDPSPFGRITGSMKERGTVTIKEGKITVTLIKPETTVPEAKQSKIILEGEAPATIKTTGKASFEVMKSEAVPEGQGGASAASKPLTVRVTALEKETTIWQTGYKPQTLKKGEFADVDLSAVDIIGCGVVSNVGLQEQPSNTDGRGILYLMEAGVAALVFRRRKNDEPTTAVAA